MTQCDVYYGRRHPTVCRPDFLIKYCITSKIMTATETWDCINLLIESIKTGDCYWKPLCMCRNRNKIGRIQLFHELQPSFPEFTLMRKSFHMYRCVRKRNTQQAFCIKCYPCTFTGHRNLSLIFPIYMPRLNRWNSHHCC